MDYRTIAPRRQALDITCRQLAGYIGRTRSWLEAIEHGRIQLHEPYAARIDRVLVIFEQAHQVAREASRTYNNGHTLLAS